MNMPRLSLLLLVMALTAGCASQPGVGPEASSAQKSAEINAEMGLRYMLQGNNERALEKLKRALKFDPDSVKAHHYIAELYRRLERPVEADEHYRAALEAAPADAELSSLHNNYGVFLCSQERIDAAEQQFLKVLDNPVYRQRAQVYENLGLCMRNKPDAAQAEVYFRKALKIDPRLPGALAAMAEISFEQDKHRSARAFLQRYSEVASHTAETLWLGIRTERILGDEDAVASYGLLLKGNFPHAPQTQEYLDSKTR